MSRERRREIVDRQHPALSTVRQCALLDISRSSLYYRRKGTSPEDLAVMEAIDQQYLATPFYGSRRMRVWLQKQGRRASRKNVQHLMRTMGLAAIYRRPRTSNPAPGHKVYPYLLGGMDITRPNQVWAADITYIPIIGSWQRTKPLSQAPAGNAAPIAVRWLRLRTTALPRWRRTRITRHRGAPFASRGSAACPSSPIIPTACCTR